MPGVRWLGRVRRPRVLSERAARRFARICEAARRWMAAEMRWPWNEAKERALHEVTPES